MVLPIYSPSGGAIIPQGGQLLGAAAPYVPNTPQAPVPASIAANAAANPSTTSPTGKDVFGNPVAGMPSAPINRSIDTPVADPAQSYLDTFRAPQSAEQIAEKKRQDARALIDSINATYDRQVGDARASGADRSSQNNAISVMSGLMGSTEAARTAGAVTEKNDKAVAAINEKRMLDLSSVYTKISQAAQDEARQQMLDANSQASDIVARRKEAQSKAVDNLKLMAASGAVDFESFKNSPQNKQVFDYAMQSVGGSEDALRGIFAINRPQDQLIGTPIRVGTTFVQAYKNPLTGKVSYDKVALPVDLPTEYTNFQKMGDNLVAIPDNWDGDVSKLVTVVGKPSTEDTLRNDLLRQQIEGVRLDNSKKSAAEASSNSSVTDLSKKAGQFDYLNTVAEKALSYAGASGRSGARKGFEKQFVGSTNYTNLEAQTNTLRTNLLTLMADPDVKKFFGPQMSNADVQFMLAGGTTINPELQSPEEMRAEILRAQDMIRRARAALGAALPSSGGNIVTAPDGTQIELTD